MQNFKVDNARSKLAEFLTGESNEFEAEKCWQCATGETYDDILFRLKELNMSLLHCFGTNVDQQVCTHMLVKTSHGHEVIIKIPDIPVTELIPMTVQEGQLTPTVVTSKFEAILEPGYSSFCFLTHLGLDTLHNEESNYAFDRPEYDVKLLGRGHHFYQCLPYVPYQNLASVSEGNDINTFLSESSSTTYFYQMVQKIKEVKLLTSRGPFTVIAPSDYIIKNRYGPLWMETMTEVAMRTIVLNHIFLGIHAEYTGSMRSLAGNEIKFVDGVPENMTLGDRYYSKSNGIVTYMHDVLYFPITNDNPIKLESNRSVSDASIAVTTYLIWKAQNALDRDMITEMRAMLAVMTGRVKKHEVELVKLEKTGRSLLKLNETYRDQLHLADVDVDTETSRIVLSSRRNELETLEQKIAQLSAKYDPHIKSGAQLTAINQLMAYYIKSVRDA
jgi:hypothetical protein